MRLVLVFKIFSKIGVFYQCFITPQPKSVSVFSPLNTTKISMARKNYGFMTYLKSLLFVLFLFPSYHFRYRSVTFTNHTCYVSASSPSFLQLCDQSSEGKSIFLVFTLTFTLPFLLWEVQVRDTNGESVRVEDSGGLFVSVAERL